MIKAQELRLGNIVLRDGEYHVIDAYDILSMSMDDIEFEGVVLTVDVLVKCGFEKSYNDGYGGYLSPKAKGSRIRVRQNTIGLWYYSNNNSTHPLYLDNLHQLQNLIFTLLQIELIITL